MIEGDRFDSKGNHKESVKIEVSSPGENVISLVVLDNTARKLVVRLTIPADQLKSALAIL